MTFLCHNNFIYKYELYSTTSRYIIYKNELYMKGNHLGELEELIMLMVGVLYPEAYGVAIKKELLIKLDRKVTLSAVHTVLNRLEQKGFLQSQFGDSTPERGGKRKRFFRMTSEGAQVLRNIREIRLELWSYIPNIALG